MWYIKRLIWVRAWPHLITEQTKLLWLRKAVLFNGYIPSVSYLSEPPRTIFTRLIWQGLLCTHWLAQTLDVIISSFINSLYIRKGCNWTKELELIWFVQIVVHTDRASMWTLYSWANTALHKSLWGSCPRWQLLDAPIALFWTVDSLSTHLTHLQ